jgi:hypothetical protein
METMPVQNWIEIFATTIITSFVLGLLHGATPDEHTWPITFSYAVGSYSTKGGGIAGLIFSLGFTLQRALLSTFGYLGLASFYIKYDLEGPVYIAVGIVMFVAGSQVLKGKYLHLPVDLLFRGKSHHTPFAERIPLHETKMRPISHRMAFVHGLIAGFGFGAYATVITFVLSPKMPNLLFAPLPGLMFGLGTMTIQVIFGTIFSTFVRAGKLKEDDLCYLGRSTAGKTLYYGGLIFILIGAVIIFIPSVAEIGVKTGFQIPNLDVLGLGTILVAVVVGIIGMGSLVVAARTARKINSSEYCAG